MVPKTIRDLFSLPETVSMTDFVHQIDGGEDEARKRRALELYQVTPSIEQKLDSALSKLRNGLRDRKSVFTWIHGSFGSGKSHFMNVLSLLLSDDPLVYETHPELQKQRADYHPAVIGRKLFRLHVQCISLQASTLEEVVFGPALKELARLHPEHPAPPLFATTKVFASANELLTSIGDEKFFAAFPANQAGDNDDEWGELASGWNRKRFDAAVVTPSSKEARDLATQLAGTPWLKELVTQAEYVRLGDGLRILTEHLKALGYEGAVFFLDELILWLTTLQEDKKRLSVETTKVATLIEHGVDGLSLPLFTFAARQRDLSQMVGHFAVGKDEEIFRDNLHFWKDRFDELSLEDKDLARIIEARVLKPKDAAAKAQIDQAFEGFRKQYQKDFNQLFGDQGDPEDFRRVYPFSPALIETMVALSSTLQRDRTALRELTNLLVDYLPDFELGKVVPVGDLFDVIVHGRVSDLGSIQTVYEQARRVYDQELLPHIRRKNGTDTADRCQLLRDDFEQRLGCSGCAEKACRTQTRIAKTVLLQGIAPNAPALKTLTASRIVALNSGTLKSIVPNQEASLASGYLRDWAAISSAIQVKGDANPQVNAALDSVDTRRILDHNRSLDNVQRRRTRVRDILFERMGVKTDAKGAHVNVTWCARTWHVGVVYENVRNATDPTFRPAEGEALRLIIDFPFDDVGHSPEEDERRLREVRERGPQKTLVWLPSFLNEEVQATLGDLVILDGLVHLRDTDFANAMPWVSADDLHRAREGLRTQLQLKQTQVENALSSAYGVTKSWEALLDANRQPERHIHLLAGDAKLGVPAQGDLNRCLEEMLKQALQRLAPRHPAFEEQPTKARLEKVLDSLVAVVQSEGRKKRFDQTSLRELKGIAAVDFMSLVRVMEDEAIYAEGLMGEVQRRLAARTGGTLSVGDVRAALDPDDMMWLSKELEDFLVMFFAAASTPPYRFADLGSPIVPVLGKLKLETALVPVLLPSVQEWERALSNAGHFGVALGGRNLSATQMETLAKKVREHVAALENAGLDELNQSLARWAGLLGINGEYQRAEVARVLLDLVRGVPGKSDYELALHLAAAPFTPERNPALRHLANPAKVAQLRDALRKSATVDLVTKGRQFEAQGHPEATTTLDALRRAFRAHEDVTALAAALDHATSALIRLLTATTSAPRPTPPIPRRPLPPTDGEIDVELPLPRHASDASGTGVRLPPEGSVMTGPQRMRVAGRADLANVQQRLSALVDEGKEFELTITVVGERS